MKKITVFDPPLCCSTGICGASVDQKLVAFAADLDWLKGHGVTVERFNLAQQPAAFVQNTMVRTALTKSGNECLPLFLLDGAIIKIGEYPSRKELADMTGVDYEPAVIKPAPILPMADAGACCPSADGPALEADGDYCPWPRQEKQGRCC